MKKPETQKAAKSKAATAEATAASAQPADQLLKADHRKVEQLFDKYEGLTEQSEKAECVQEICKQLIVHALLEEGIFYPACRAKGVKSDMLDEAQVEHDGAKVMIRELMAEESGADFYDAKVSVLAEYIKHHVGEEEKGSEGIFALARQAGVDMDALGSELQARKTELTQEFEQAEPAAPEFLSLHSLESANQSWQEKNMPRYESEGRGYSRSGGRSSSGRERDDHGRFMSDDDERGYSRGRSSSSRDRDEYGRFTSDDDDRDYSRGRSSSGRERDDYGRFTRDDDDRSYSRGGSSRGRYEDDDRGYSRSRSGSRYENEDDRDHGRGGWFGDSEGHSEASRRGWENRGSSGRSLYDDDDRSYRSSSSSRGRSRYDDDDDGRSQGRGGWFGDPEGHSEASRRGWESRSGSGGRSRSSYDDDDRRDTRSGGNGGSGRGQGGWFGDSRGHAEAARRGWRNRD